jgi:hypothetical protein
LDDHGKPILPAIGHPSRGTPDRLRTGGMQTWDASLFKNFPIGSKAERSVQIRCEAYNVFNRSNFNGADLGANFNLPSYNSDGTYTPESVSLDSAFREPNSVFDQKGPGGPRVIQLGAKFVF